MVELLKPYASKGLKVRKTQAATKLFVRPLRPFASKELTVHKDQAVAKLLVQLQGDQSFSQVSCRAAEASCFQRAWSLHVKLEPCGGKVSYSVIRWTAKPFCFQRAYSLHVKLEPCGCRVSTSVIQRLHMRRYPGLRSSYKFNWWAELYCIYTFLHNAARLRRFLQAQQLSV